MSLVNTFRLTGIQSLGTDLLLGVSGSVWVQSQENLLVEQWVLLLNTSTLGECGSSSSTDNGLQFGGVDETSNIGLGDNVGWEEEVLLEGRWGGGGTIDVVKSLESR